ncbi:FG-GAP repeat domain-containing protein [Streptomyces kutzneri]|uniref:FG-GAP repeat domain-containing protein n=1 Tax=Streptomyces kutzneri TaxID=3051179 RepID=UPI0028D8C3B9|nr:VCBS repeat-containing protein [Streptomyces sp. DSM 40907]
MKSTTVAAGASFTAKLTPPGAGPHFVYAFSQDAAGNRSDTTMYPFYAARTQAVDVPHDLNGDGFRDIWSSDLFGSLLTYAGQGNGKFSATIGSADSFAGSQVAALGDWNGDHYNDMVTLEQRAGMTRKTLWIYRNNGQGAVGKRSPEPWTGPRTSTGPTLSRSSLLATSIMTRSPTSWSSRGTSFGPTTTRLTVP